MRYDDNEIPFESTGTGPVERGFPENILSAVGAYEAAFQHFSRETRVLANGSFTSASHAIAVRFSEAFEKALSVCEGTRYAVPPAHIEPRRKIHASLIEMAANGGVCDDQLTVNGYGTKTDLINDLAEKDEEWLEGRGLDAAAWLYHDEHVENLGGPKS